MDEISKRPRFGGLFCYFFHICARGAFLRLPKIKDNIETKDMDGTDFIY